MPFKNIKKKHLWSTTSWPLVYDTWSDTTVVTIKDKGVIEKRLRKLQYEHKIKELRNKLNEVGTLQW